MLSTASIFLNTIRRLISCSLMVIIFTDSTM